ncbi:MAG: dihydrofolate reductase, partial [Chloroflexi bacterium]|nr:dihydrofolate reductase [Chloroflexota bacterium]
KGDHPLVDDHADVHGGAPFRVSAASADYVRGMWSRQRVLVIGRHQFDLTNGWEGHPPANNLVVVVSHRPKPAGWHPEASYHFATSVEEGIARARELAGEGEIAVGAGEVGGQALALGLIDYVAIDIVPVVFGRGKPYFGALANGPLLLEDPDVVLPGDGVLHLRYPIRR